MAKNQVFSAKKFKESIRPINRFTDSTKPLKDYRSPECLNKPHPAYILDGKNIPSVTAIIHLIPNDALIKWANNIGKLGMDSDVESEKATIIGSAFHLFIEKMCPNSKKDLETLTKEFNEIMDCCNHSMRSKINNSILSFNKWFEKNPSFTILESELSLISYKYKYGGTIDGVVKLDNYICLLDYKTSKEFYAHHFTQLSAYNQLLLENTEYRPEFAIILKLDKEKGNTAKMLVYEIAELEPHFKLFKQLRKSYDAIKTVDQLWPTHKRDKI